MQLVDSWGDTPAFVHDKHLTVLAANALARAILPGLDVGINMARFTFLDERIATDATGISDEVASVLRESLQRHNEDPVFIEIVGELSARSREFAEAWANDDVRAPTTRAHRLEPEGVEPMTLAYQQLQVPGRDEEILVVWKPCDPNSELELARLANIIRGSA